MINSLISKIIFLDELSSRAYISILRERNSLMIFNFHALFKDKNEIALNHVDPQQEITTDIFSQFIEYYLKYDYRFISPQNILDGLENNKKYALITFDDGYFNNHLALPILQEYRVPAVFFISTQHITKNRCFWWDVVYRERLNRGYPIDRVKSDFAMLKLKKNSQIENYILDTFGAKSLNPISDIDRPFTPTELNRFSKEDFVFLGNHTSNHAILTNYHSSEVKSEILDAQNSIFSFTGTQPTIISYPNGNYSSEIISISKECGLKLGVTTNGYKNYLPINQNRDQPFLLNRFILLGNKDIRTQCALFRSDVQFFKTIIKHLKERRR